ncbi:MAG: dihydropteroate synthase [Deltaproteobacteria bacterium]|nr:dihydropteroate synthase [Deltaproteobacteria bacterium]
MPRQFVVLGLGSNLGDRLEHLSRAVAGMSLARTAFLSETRCSEVFESEALLLPDSPADWNIPFYNIAIAGFTVLSARTLLERVKALELTLGREKRGRWAPREIDIDILVYGDARIDDEDLKIPHAGLLERPFALWPLAALAPQYRLQTGKGESTTPLDASRRWGFEQAKIPCRTWRAPAAAQKEFRAKLKNPAITIQRGPLCETELVGIINVTPDSFSDGGTCLEPSAAVEHAAHLHAGGAGILDIGAESTRPHAGELSAAEEWLRLEPVIAGIKKHFQLNPLAPLLSIDTRHAETARKALKLGADWINDVSGFSDPDMIAAVAESNCTVVAMHSLSIPPSKEKVLSNDRSAVSQVYEWAQSKILALEKAGIARDRIVIDPGLGFGKTPQQSLLLAFHAEQFLSLGVRILIGHSRKSFLSLFTPAEADKRDGETAILSALLASKGIQYLRVHNIERTAAALASIMPIIPRTDSAS